MTKPKPQAPAKPVQPSHINLSDMSGERAEALVHLADAAREQSIALQKIAAAFSIIVPVLNTSQAKD